MAYEEQVFANILDRLLARVIYDYPDIDTREGSFIYTALAPAALELESLYQELNMFNNETFAATASRDGLIKRASEIGLEVKNASYGEFKGKFNVNVPLGTRFNNAYYNYTVTEKIGTEVEDTKTYYTFKLTCETAGSAPNKVLGELKPIDYVPEINYAQLVECLIEGEDEEDTEALRIRYFQKVNGYVTDGNVAQYEWWCENYDGIGSYKVTPCWNGVNTVKVSILNSSNEPASTTLINEFQNYLDPGSTGMGDGVAPIGAIVTVTTASTTPISVSFKAKLADGYTYDSSLTTQIEKAISNYLSSIAYKKNVINYMTIGATIMNLDFIEFISDLKVNNTTSDITIADEYIPMLATSNPVEWQVIES